MGLLDGVREWQFRRNEDNFWRQATPALRQHLNPGSTPAPATTKLDRIRAAHLRNGERETAFACRGLATANTPAERARVHAQYSDMVQRNARDLGKKFGVGIELGQVPTLAALAPVCSRRAGARTGR